MEAGCVATVEVVLAVVDGEGVFLAVERELAGADAVAVTADGGAEEGAWVLDVGVNGWLAENDVSRLAGLVLHDEGDDDRTEVGDADLSALGVGENIEVDCLALDSGFEGFGIQARECLGHSAKKVKCWNTKSCICTLTTP